VEIAATQWDLPDDPVGIPDEAILWRRVPAMFWKFEERRPKSQGFANHPDSNDVAMSVSVAAIWESLGKGPTDALCGHQGFGLVALTAAHFRAEKQAVALCATTDDPGHAVVVGEKGERRRKRWSKHSELVVLLEPQPGS
jgi:hypothetical protein